MDEQLPLFEDGYVHHVPDPDVPIPPDMPTGDIIEIPFRLYDFLLLQETTPEGHPVRPSITFWYDRERWHVSLHHRAKRLVTYWSDPSLQEVLNHLELGLKHEAMRWRPSRYDRRPDSR